MRIFYIFAVLVAASGLPLLGETIVLPDGKVTVDGVAGWYYPSGELADAADTRFYSVGVPVYGNHGGWLKAAATFLGTGNPDSPLTGSVSVPSFVTIEGSHIPVIGISGAFRNATSKSVEILDGVAEFGDFTFFDASNIVTLTLPVGLEYIGDRVFCGMVDLKDLYFRSPMPPICVISKGNNFRQELGVGDSPGINTPDYATPFAQDGSEVRFNMHVPRGSRSLYLCQNAIAKLDGNLIMEYDAKVTHVATKDGPAGLTFSIAGNFLVEAASYEEVGNATTIAIPALITPEKAQFPEVADHATASVFGIGYRAFAGNSTLKEITLPATALYARDEAFAGCGAEVVTAGANLNFVGEKAFADMKNLKKFILPARTDERSWYNWAHDAFDGIPEDAVLYCEDGDIRVKGDQLPWSRFSKIRPLETLGIETAQDDALTYRTFAVETGCRDGEILCKVKNVSEKPVMINVYDISGVKAVSEMLDSGQECNPELSKGLYLITDGKTTLKIVL